MKLTFLKLFIKQACKILFIFLMWMIHPILNSNEMFVISFYVVSFLIGMSLFIYIGVKIKRNANFTLKRKKVYGGLLILSSTSILSLTILRICDFYQHFHPCIKWIAFFGFYGLIFIIILVVLWIKIKEILNVKGDNLIHQIIERNKKIKDYPDEGIFYDSFGYNIVFVLVNTILIILCFFLAIFLMRDSIPKNITPCIFENDILWYFALITTSFYFICSLRLLFKLNRLKSFRIQKITIMLLLMNMFLDILILYLNKKIYILLFGFQIAGFLIFIINLLAYIYFKTRYGTFKSNENSIKKLENNHFTGLEDFLKCDNKAVLRCLCGNKNKVNEFVDLACELQLEMIKCGQIFKERKDYYDYTIRINCSRYEDPEEACQDIKTKMKEYFKIKYGFIFGYKHIIELISRVKPFGFIAKFLQKSDTSFFDEDCSRINVILENYYGYSKDKAWIKKLCVFASKLQITLTFTSKSMIEAPNESFSIVKIKV